MAVNLHSTGCVCRETGNSPVQLESGSSFKVLTLKNPPIFHASGTAEMTCGQWSVEGTNLANERAAQRNTSSPGHRPHGTSKLKPKSVVCVKYQTVAGSVCLEAEQGSEKRKSPRSNHGGLCKGSRQCSGAVRLEAVNGVTLSA